MKSIVKILYEVNDLKTYDDLILYLKKNVKVNTNTIKTVNGIFDLLPCKSRDIYKPEVALLTYCSQFVNSSEEVDSIFDCYIQLEFFTYAYFAPSLFPITRYTKSYLKSVIQDDYLDSKNYTNWRDVIKRAGSVTPYL